MHKTSSIIGIAVAIVLLVMAYRIYNGADGIAKVGEFEVSVVSNKNTQQDPSSAPPKQEQPVITVDNKKEKKDVPWQDQPFQKDKPFP